MTENKELEAYKSGLWDFILEHCDIAPGGALFVKFHTSGWHDLDKRIRARVRGYHREDVRAKEKVHTDRTNAVQDEKRRDREEYKKARDARVRKWRRKELLKRFIRRFSKATTTR